MQGRNQTNIRTIEVAAAIIENDEGRVLICRRALDSPMGGLWEFPGGKREAGETFERCLIRECREELGVEIKIKREFAKTEYETDTGLIKFVFYEAEIASGELHKNVHKSIKWVLLRETSDYSFCPADREILKKLRARSS